MTWAAASPATPEEAFARASDLAGVVIDVEPTLAAIADLLAEQIRMAQVYEEEVPPTLADLAARLPVARQRLIDVAHLYPVMLGREKVEAIREAFAYARIPATDQERRAEVVEAATGRKVPRLAELSEIEADQLIAHIGTLEEPF